MTVRLELIPLLTIAGLFLRLAVNVADSETDVGCVAGRETVVTLLLKKAVETVFDSTTTKVDSY